jgi:hypothetical protein
MAGLIRAAVERFLRNEIQTIADYYHSGPSIDGSPGILSDVITEQSIPPAPGRGAPPSCRPSPPTRKREEPRPFSR